MGKDINAILGAQTILIWTYVYLTMQAVKPLARQCRRISWIGSLITYLFWDGWTIIDTGTKTTARKKASDMLSKDSENRTSDWKINVIDFNNFQSNDNFLSSAAFLKWERVQGFRFFFQDCWAKTGGSFSEIMGPSISNKTNSTNLYPPTKGYLRETCKSQNINPIYLTLSSPTVSFRS